MNRTKESLSDQALKAPLATLEYARELLDQGDNIDQVETWRAIGVSHRMLGDLNESEAALLHAADLAETDNEWGRCALSLGATLLLQGRVTEGLDLMRQTIKRTSGIARAEARFQLGTGFARAGRFEETLVQYRHALPVIRRNGRKDWEAHLLANRGTVHQYLGNYSASLRDLDQAIMLNQELQSPTQRAYAQRNKAETLYLSGDLADALRLYQTADDALLDLGVSEDQLTDKADAMMAAGLFGEVISLCQGAFHFHKSAGNAYGQLDALAPAAEAALALGEHATVAAMMNATVQVPGADEFPDWVHRVQLASLRSKTLTHTATENDLDAALALTEDGSSSLGPVQAMKVGLTTASVALELGETSTAVEVLGQLARWRQRSPLYLQIEWWALTARLRATGELNANPLRAVQAGLRIYQDLVLSTGSFELRVLANRRAEELIAISLDLLAQAGDPTRLVALIEKVRGGAFVRHEPVPARSARRLETALRELAAAEAAVRRDRRPRETVLTLQRRAAQLSRTAAPQRRKGTRELSTVRDDETLLTFIEHRGDLHAIHQTASHVELKNCGSLATLRAAIESQTFATRQLARSSRLSRRARRSLLTQLAEASQELSDRCFGRDLTDRVLINPSTTMQSMSWAALPILSRRPHVVCPALHVARRSLPKQPQIAFIAGAAELAHVPPELDGVARAYGVDPITDPNRSQLGGLSGVDVMHLAGHFAPNGQNPLFSYIPFADEVLHAHDVLALASAPAISVLSACSSGLSDVVVGAPLGFASALLAAGGASVVVGQSTIEDGAVIAELMRDVHQALHRGVGPAEALCDQRQNVDEEAAVVAGSLAVLGTGW